MLDILVRYAHDRGLEPEPGFKAKDVRWAIVCDADSRFLNVLQLGDTSQKNNPGQTFHKCPDLSQPEMVAGGETKSHFLVETAEVVALYGKNAVNPKVRERHQYFVKLHQDAGTSMPELARLAEQLGQPETIGAIRSRFESQKVKPSEKVTFRIGSAYPVESDAWHDWWREFRKGLAGGKSEEKEGVGKKSARNKDASALMRCFVTRELVEPVPTHLKIEKLADVGGQRSGDALICFDKEAFRSYRLEQSANAAISEQSMASYCAALNHLIKRRGRRLAGAKVVHWFKRRDVPEEDDPMAWLEEGAVQQELNAQRRAEELLQSIQTGKRPDLANNYFYALTLSGAAGRVMVRDWMEGRFEELVTNICAWFDDLEIVNLSGVKSARTPGIERVITCLLPLKKKNQEYKDWIKPIGAERLSLWQAAIRGRKTPISHSAVSRAVLLNREFCLSAKLEEALQRNDDRANTLSLLYARMGLMKAYHLRKNREGGRETMTSELKPYLNEDHPHPAYHCGRLMAVLAALQRAALGDIGAGVVQRYYAAASSTPALVLGRLTRTSQFHLNKLEQGLAYWYESKIAQIWSRIKDGIPGTLSLEEQSLFALGYYQQIAHMRTKRSDKSENQPKEEDNNE